MKKSLKAELDVENAMARLLGESGKRAEVQQSLHQAFGVQNNGMQND